MKDYDDNNSGTVLHDGSVVAITINYNGGQEVLRCLDSLLKQTRPINQIVVVDNKSSDNSIAMARQRFPSVIFIESPSNEGWGVGCNRGIQTTASEFVVLVNNDAYLEPDCVEKMIEGVRQSVEYGSCASRILLADDSQTIEAAGVAIFRDGSSIGRGRLRPAAEYSEAKDVFCANDCCCLYRREMLAQIGIYDPDFFIYCDETDVGWRQQLAGWRCIYNPEAVAYHSHSYTAGSYTDFKAFHVERNRLFLCFKYFPVLDLFASIVYAAARFVLQVWFSAGGKGALSEYRKKHSLLEGFVVLVKANWAAICKLPIMWRRRRAFMPLRKLTNRQFERLFKDYGVSIKDMAGYV
jgi:GT2 family glycosyltransferase